MKRRTLTSRKAVAASPTFGARRGGSPLTRPPADLSPEGRGAEDERRVFYRLYVANEATVRTSPLGERSAEGRVRGPADTDETGRNSQLVQDPRFITPA